MTASQGKSGASAPCPSCGRPKGKARIEVSIRASARAPRYRQIDAAAITVCGRCGETLFKRAAEQLGARS